MRRSGPIAVLLVASLCLASAIHAQEAPGNDGGVSVLEPSLVALGTLGASNAYYSYLVIGSAADAFVGGSYDSTLTNNILGEVIFLNTGAVESLQAMLDANGLSLEDKAALRSLIETHQLLLKQARALQAFVNDRNNQGQEYQDYRQKAWEKIRLLFGK